MTCRHMLLALCFLVACGCGNSHAQSADAGADSTAPPDLGPVQVSVFGQCTEEEEATCGCIDGFRRCDTCEEDCPFGWSCSDSALVCRNRPLPDHFETCLFVSDGDGRVGHYCSTGLPCVVDAAQQGTSESPFSGVCMPESFCRSISTADPPLAEARKCVYSDGSDFINGPPTSECPFNDASARWCGGSCGSSDMCPDVPVFGIVMTYEPGSCLGVSETRGYGMCAVSRDVCRQSEPADNQIALTNCGGTENESCVCVVADGDDVGIIATDSACSAYASSHSDVSCRGANWEEL